MRQRQFPWWQTTKKSRHGLWVGALWLALSLGSFWLARSDSSPWLYIGWLFMGSAQVLLGVFYVATALALRRREQNQDNQC